MSIMKVVVMGDKASGKTTLLNAANNKSSSEIPKPTIGIEFTAIQSKTHDLRMQNWDVGSLQSAKESQLTTIFDNTQAVMICVDLSKEFDSAALNKQLDIVKRRGITDITLIGTKADIALPNSIESIQAFARENQCSYQITSAENNSEYIKKFFTDKLDTYAETLAPSQNHQNTTKIDYAEKLVALVDNTFQNKKLRKTLDNLGKDLNKGHPDRAENIYNLTKDFIDKAKTDEYLEDLCKNYLNDYKNSKYSSTTLEKLVKAVVVAAVFAFLTASIAVGICATLGLGAVAIAGAGVGVAGIAAVSSGSVSFFKKNNVENVAHAAKAAFKDDETSPVYQS